MKYSKIFTSIPLATAFVSSLALADIPNTFSAGSPARASEVNENFQSIDAQAIAAQSSATEALEKAITVEASVSEISAQVTTVATDVTSLDSKVTSLASTVSGLSSSLESSASSVELDVNCTDDSKALVNAYAANATAMSITFNLTGDCEGDYQGLDPINGDISIMPVFAADTPNVTLNGGDNGASIYANSDTGLVNIVSSNASLTIDNIDIVAGNDELYPLWIVDNAKGQFSGVSVSGGTSSEGLINVHRSSSLQAINLTVDSSEIGLNVADGSHAEVRNFTSNTETVSKSIRAFGASLLLTGTQTHSRLNIGNGSIATLGSDSIVIATQVDVYACNLYQFTGSTLTVNGNVNISDGGQFSSREITINNGYLNVDRGSSIRGNGPLVMTGDSRLRVRRNSTAVIVGAALQEIDVLSNSSLILEGESDEVITVQERVKVENGKLTATSTDFSGVISAEVVSTVVFDGGITIGGGHWGDEASQFFGEFEIIE